MKRLGCLSRPGPVQEQRRPGQLRDAFLNRGRAFQAPAWARCGLHAAAPLWRVHRQTDEHYVQLLDAIRSACDLRSCPSPLSPASLPFVDLCQQGFGSKIQSTRWMALFNILSDACM